MSAASDAIIRRAAKRGLRGPNSRGEYSVCCPFCEKTEGKVDTKFKLQLNPVKGLYNCYRCRHGGHVDLRWLEQPEAGPAPEKPKESLGPPEGFVKFAGNEGALSLRPYEDYLKKRGVYEQTARVDGGACLNGKYAGRVVVPLRATGGSWAGFAARAIYSGMEPKYLYPAGMDRKSSLWGMNLPYSDDIWLVEGVFDALPLYPEGVAAFGKNVTEEQLDILATGMSYKRVIVCLDGDAWEEGQVIASRLNLRGKPALWAKLPPGEDPGTLGRKVKDYIVTY